MSDHGQAILAEVAGLWTCLAGMRLALRAVRAGSPDAAALLARHDRYQDRAFVHAAALVRLTSR